MGAFRALITGELAPVGQRVHTLGLPAPPPEFPGYSTLWTSSGTAALVLALRLAKARRQSVVRPKVLLPAYGCPDLLTAAVVAGVEPMLVDIGPDSPRFDCDALVNAWQHDVVAVVAVNFLGIREHVSALREWAGETALVIEDRAQAYPEGDLDADAVILSFGRGKPVNLLGGGALLLKDGIGATGMSLPQVKGRAWFRLSAAAFNFAIRPRRYAWIARLPMLRVGETRYRPSTRVRAMDGARIGLIQRNASAWLDRQRWREEVLTDALAMLPEVSALPAKLREGSGRLLRYPLLIADKATRDRALLALNAHGLGASALYGQPMNRVADVPPQIAAQGEFAGAQRFADRLLTLPLHDGVTREHLTKMVEVLCEEARRRGGDCVQ